MTRKITCKNSHNISMIFGDDFSPWLLSAISGLYSFTNKISSSDNTVNDGAEYMGTVTQPRNIVMTLRDKAQTKANRDALYNTFEPHSTGVFIYEDDGKKYQIAYHVESVDIPEENYSLPALISLLCMDPYFEDTEKNQIQMSGWTSLFQWQHEFLDAKEAFGERFTISPFFITNDTASDNIGLTITMKFDDSFYMPGIKHVQDDKFVQVNETFYAGDEFIISTKKGDKNVYMVRDGITSKINSKLVALSEFFQLRTGKNTFELLYYASSDPKKVNVTFEYNLRYAGV